MPLATRRMFGYPANSIEHIVSGVWLFTGLSFLVSYRVDGDGDDFHALTLSGAFEHGPFPIGGKYGQHIRGAARGVALGRNQSPPVVDSAPLDCHFGPQGTNHQSVTPTARTFR